MTSQETLRVGGGTVGGGDLTDLLVTTSVWTDSMLVAAGIPIVDVPFVSIGGGIGSFVTFDYLRIAGVPNRDLRVLGDSRSPVVHLRVPHQELADPAR